MGSEEDKPKECYRQLYEYYEKQLREFYSSSEPLVKVVVLEGLERLVENLEALPDDDKLIEKFRGKTGVRKILKQRMGARNKTGTRNSREDAVKNYMDGIGKEKEEKIRQIMENGINTERLNGALRDLKEQGITQEDIALDIDYQPNSFRALLSKKLRKGEPCSSMAAVRFYEYLVDKGYDLT